MAQLVLAVGGALIGGAIGGPWGARIGWAVGSYIGGAGGAESTTINGPRLEDLRITNSTYGSPIHRVWGTAAVPGVVIWSSDLIETVKKKTSGGKGGGGGTTVKTYSYSVDCAVLVCQGPIRGIKRIWANGLLIYDPAGLIADPKVLPNGITVYLGTETQAPDALIQSYEGAANVPAFRGSAYVAIEGMQLEKFGNRMPSFSFEVVQSDGVSVELKHSWSGGTFTGLGLLIARDYYVLGRSGGYVRLVNRATGAVTDVLVDGGGGGAPLVQGLGDASRYVVMLGGPNGTKAHVVDLVKRKVAATFAVQFISTDITPAARTGGLYGQAFLESEAVHIYTTGSGGNVVTYAIPSGYQLQTRSFPNLSSGPRIVADNDGAIYQIPRNPIAAPYDTRLSRLGTDDVVTNFDLSGYGGLLLNFGYDPVRNSLVIITGTKLIEWSVVSESVVQTFSIGSTGSAYLSRDALEPALWWVRDENASEILAIDLAAGAVRKTIAYSGGVGPMVGASLGVYSLDSGSPGLLNFYSEGGPVTLAEIVTDACGEVGLAPADLDVADLTAEVLGYIQTRPMTARALIEPLQQAFWFDGVESDYVLRFVSRGGASVRTLGDDDLVRVDDELIEVRRTSELEVPREVRAHFIDVDADYDPGMQYDRRLTGGSQDVLALQLPIVMDAAQAKRIAEVNLAMVWMNRTATHGVHTVENLDLDPTDVITLPVEGSTATARLIRTLHGSHQVEFDAVLEDASIYSPVGDGVFRPTPAQRQILPVSYTELFLMDAPPLRDADDELLIYTAASDDGYGSWDGAVLYSSSDGGSTWAERLEFDSECVYGTVDGVIPATGAGNIFDYDNDINVEAISGSLESTSELAVLNGANALWAAGEIIQFVTATETSEGAYTLSGILRGRRGTEWAMGGHIDGESFVLLETATVLRLMQGFSEVGQTRLYKGVTAGRTLGEEAAVTLVLEGNSLKPLSPVHLEAVRDGSSNITLTWVRRTRIDGEWRDGTDAGLGEASESYEIDIYDTGFTTLKRTITATSQTAAYSAADQTTDFGSPQSSVGVRIYQISARIGRGHPAEAVL